MSVDRHRARCLGLPRLASVILLVATAVCVLLLFHKGPDAEALQTSEEPVTTQPAVEDETDNPSTTVAGDEPSTDSTDTGLIVFTGVVVVAIVVVIATTRLKRSSSPTGSLKSWPHRAEAVAREGRKVVDLTISEDFSEGESGLTVSELGLAESRLELLIAHLRDAEMTAPSQDSRNALSLAAAHAHQLNRVVQTERHLRLSSPAPDEAMLEELASQLAAERTALDQALRDLSRSKEGSL